MVSMRNASSHKDARIPSVVDKCTCVLLMIAHRAHMGVMNVHAADNCQALKKLKGFVFRALKRWSCLCFCIRISKKMPRRVVQMPQHRTNNSVRFDRYAGICTVYNSMLQTAIVPVISYSFSVF